MPSHTPSREIDLPWVCGKVAARSVCGGPRTWLTGVLDRSLAVLAGKYMQMMNMLKPIAFDVVHFMSQLFDYYLYAVYTFFGRNDSVSLAGTGG